MKPLTEEQNAKMKELCKEGMTDKKMVRLKEANDILSDIIDMALQKDDDVLRNSARSSLYIGLYVFREIIDEEMFERKI